MLKYIELKSGHNDNGPAWIARVRLSKSGRTVYFGDKALKRTVGPGVSGNHIDVETREEYWVSGVKKDGLDRHWAGSGVTYIEESAVGEYLGAIGAAVLAQASFKVIPDLPEPKPARFVELENARLPVAPRPQNNALQLPAGNEGLVVNSKHREVAGGS